MEIWISLPSLPIPELAELADFAEEIGIDGLAVSEHIAVPSVLTSDYPYTGSRAVLDPATQFPDPAVLIAALSMRTSRLRFMTGVTIAALRHPLLLAKSFGTAAVVCGGRLDLGLGVGWMREEFDALGVPFDERSARTEEMVPILRELWTGAAVGHRGRFFDFAPMSQHPHPPEPVRMLFGGDQPRALRRAARLGDGWIGLNPDLEKLAAVLDSLRAALGDEGRQQDEFVVRTGIKGRPTAASIAALERLDVAGLVLTPWQLVPKSVPLTLDNVVKHLPGLVASFRDVAVASNSEVHEDGHSSSTFGE
jgi:probable F420-dependent oxidoreductase